MSKRVLTIVILAIATSVLAPDFLTNTRWHRTFKLLPGYPIAN